MNNQSSDPAAFLIAAILILGLIFFEPVKNYIHSALTPPDTTSELDLFAK